MQAMFSFHSFAHYCRGQSGHPYSYHSACQEAIESLKGQFYAYVHEECSISPLPEGWARWFPSISNQQQKGRFFRRCRQIFRQKGNNRIFFLESFGRRDLRLFVFSALLFGRKSDAIWILFRDDHIWKRRRDRFQVRIFQKLLRLKFGKRLFFLSDSHSIAVFLKEKMDQTIHVMPLPHIDFPALAFQKPTHKPITCGFIGEPRKEKGIHQILDLLRLKDPAAAHFSLIVSEDMAIKSSNMHVNYHAPALSREAYIETISKSDILLLPYDAYRYRRRTSGIFVEAIWMGKIPLVKDDTWLSAELKRYDLHELIVDWNDPLFFSNLEKLLDNPVIYEKLANMQADYQKHQAFDAFTRKIEELVS